jgi:hypothetical protein
MYDGDGWDSAPEGGDVLFGVDKQQLERLYQQHQDEGYLQQMSYVFCSAAIYSSSR